MYRVCCAQLICVYAVEMAELSSSVADPRAGQMSKIPNQMSHSQVLLDQNFPLGKLALRQRGGKVSLMAVPGRGDVWCACLANLKHR